MVGTSVFATSALWFYALHVREGEWTAVLLPLVATPAVIVGGLIVGALLYVARIGVRNVVPSARLTLESRKPRLARPLLPKRNARVDARPWPVARL